MRTRDLCSLATTEGVITVTKLLWLARGTGRALRALYRAVTYRDMSDLGRGPWKR